MATDVLEPFGPLHRQPDDAAHAVLSEADALGMVAHLDTITIRDFELLVGKALTRTHGLDG